MYELPQAPRELPEGYRFNPRRDPEAPLLAILHGDGMDERSILSLGRDMWPGAPLLRPRGSVPHARGWRFLGCDPGHKADLDREIPQLDRLAVLIEGVLHAREASLVEVVAVGIDGGADAIVGLLCHAPRHLAAAVLYRPGRAWHSLPAAAQPLIDGVEVLIVTDRKGLLYAEAASGLLDQSGAKVTLVEGNLDVPLPPGIMLGRTWLRARLRGYDGSV